MTRARPSPRDPAQPEEERTDVLAEPLASHPTLEAIWAAGSERFVLPPQGRAVVGRSVQADLVIEHASLSRLHAALEIGEGVIWTDLGSSHGTMVRGQRLAEGARTHVDWGEPVELGSVIVIARRASRPSTRTEGAPPPPPPTGSQQEVERWIELVAGTEMSVLLLGETGVGKGFFAREIHTRSSRAAGPFVHINCAALARNLIESELFGHERGAFTGATQAKPGLLESASGGTVFLDEIGEMPLDVQAKLLVALERREVTRVGGLQPRAFDVRLIAATNRDLGAEAASARFRTDLYFRLAGLPLVVPPLRERRDEIVPLATAFLAAAAERMRRPAPAMSADAADALRAHAWPGNVRELMTVMERAVLVSQGAVGGAQIAACIQPTGRLGGLPAAPSFALGASTPQLDEAPPSSPLRRDDADLRERIIAALEQCAGNQSRAAEVLGISRRTLIHRMDELDLPRPRKR